MAHRMLLGSEPWTAETLPHLVAQIAYEPLPVPSERGSHLGPEFDQWFARCCARQPADRFATAAEAVNALALALGHDSPMVASGTDFALASARVSSKRSSSKDAFAATAVSGAQSAIGSDTLAAQVTTKKGPSKVVMVAVVAVVVGLLGGGLIMLLRAPGAQSEPSDPAARPTAEVSTAATPEPSSARPVVQPTTSPELLPAASAGPAPSASAKAPLKPPAGNGTKPVTKPPSTATTPTTTPKDPLDMGRK